MKKEVIEKDGFFKDWGDDEFQDLMVETALARNQALMPNPPALTQFYFDNIDEWFKRNMCGMRCENEDD